MLFIVFLIFVRDILSFCKGYTFGLRMSLVIEGDKFGEMYQATEPP